jgi:hypothetical protein
MEGLEPVDYADRLRREITRAQKAEWGKGDLLDWVLESNKAAREGAYAGITGDDGMKGEPIALTADYLKKNKEVVRDRLQKAGVRLARVLNEAFE